MQVTRTSVTVRPYLPGDEPAVLALLEAALGGGPAGRRPPEFFRWKHFANPFGRSYLLVAERDGQVVGLRAFLRWRFTAEGGRVVWAARAVDTATHPDHQGQGIFSTLTRAALGALASDTDLVFNTPNGKSRPGYLKLGWEEAGQARVLVRPRRPLRLVAGTLGRARPARAGTRVDAPPAARALERGDQVQALLAAAGSEQPGRLRTPRSLEYLRWRYGAAPLLDYRAVSLEREGELRGLALFRVRPRGPLWEATVAELLVPPGDTAAAQALLRQVAGAARTDHLTLHAPAGSTAARAAARAGFLPAPRGIGMVVRPLRGPVRPDPTRLASWALTLGDLEVF